MTGAPAGRVQDPHACSTTTRRESIDMLEKRRSEMRIALCPYTEVLTEGMSIILCPKDPAALARQ